MVGVKKLSALAVFSAVAVSGAVASLQPADASHAHHHRSLAERQLQQQQQPAMIKVQKRLIPAVADGLGGVIGGAGKALGLGGGQESGGSSASSSGSASAAPPASTTRAPSNNAGASSTEARASTRPAAAASSRPSSISANSNGGTRPNSSSSNNSATNNNGSNRNNDNNGSNRASNNDQSSSSNNSGNRGSAQQQQAAAASAAPTDTNSAVAAASASAASAAASAISANSASQASADALASAEAASAAASVSGAANAAATTGVDRANSNSSSNGSDGTTKVVVPIVVIVASIALIAVAAVLIRRYRSRNDDEDDFHSHAIEKSYHHRSMVGAPLAAGGAAFAVGGAAAGLTRDRPRRDSWESFHNIRPMSNLTEEEGDNSGAPPPMQEVAPYEAAVGGAYPAESSRLRNYGSARGGRDGDDFPPAHRITDSMYVDDVAEGRAVTPFTDEHGAYDVNYYDGSSTVGYNNPAARGMDAAGASGAGRPYSPYADLQRGESGGDGYYDYDRASSNRRDPFGDSKRWSG